MTHALIFQNLTLGYDRSPAVRQLNGRIEAGSLTAIVGPNGAGKSTLLKGTMGQLSPLEGQICIGQLAKRDIAYLAQHTEIDRSFPLSVLDLVSMGLWHQVGGFGSLRTADANLVSDAISAVGLDGLETRPIGHLSGGQLQRALFARLLLQDARLILLDEPFASIDARTMTDLIEVIGRWHGEGRTVIAVLHDVETVRSHFPNTMILARDLVAHGPTADVLTAENQMRARQMCEACAGPPHTCVRQVA